MNVILASSSPRRQELLKNIFKEFDIIAPDIDENDYDDKIFIEEVPEFISEKKAEKISKENPDSLVIACDTAVFIDKKMLGKPSDEQECTKMLSALSGNTHKVISGCSIHYKNHKRNFSVITFVTFNHLSEMDIKEYISTQEPFDKAGGYAIQGFGSLLVKKINGDFYNVVGLPLSRLNKEIKLLLSSLK